MHRRPVGVVGVVAALALCAVALAGCGPYASGLKTATAGAGASAAGAGTATVPSPPFATPPPFTPVPPGRTGIASVDAALDAVAARDAQALVKQIQYEKVACVTKSEGIGAPPQCLPSEPEGTPIDVLPVAQCEGSFTRPDEVAQPLTSFLGTSAKLYAVYNAEPDSYPPGKYVAVFAVDSPTFHMTVAHALYLDDRGITGIHFGCAQTPDQFVDFNRLTGRWILPPPDRQPPHDTGVPSVDAALRALAAGDEDALLAQVHPIALPCGAPEGDPSFVRCTPGVPNDTIVRVIAVAQCAGGYQGATDSNIRAALNRVCGFSGGLRRPCSAPIACRTAQSRRRRATRS